jgi:secernin
MGSDVVVALGPATQGGTFLGFNGHRPPGERQRLRKTPGRSFSLGERVNLPSLDVPQVRQTATVLGWQPAGCWGYYFGVNEHQVALGCAHWESTLSSPQPALAGTDLVRLALERGRSARQAVDVLTGLVERHGQGLAQDDVSKDHLFLVADPHEALAVETAGSHWVYQQIREVRAVSDAGVIRQDWDRIAPGLADLAIRRGAWPADGSKLDFVGALCDWPTGERSGLRRWGRATLLLEQQNGVIDLHCLRRLLADHYEGTRFEVNPLDPEPGPSPLCQHGPLGEITAASLVARLAADEEGLPVLWYAAGPPCLAVALPVFLDGDLPETLADSEAADSVWARSREVVRRLRICPERWMLLRELNAPLQARLDHEAEEFAHEAARWKKQGKQDQLRRFAGLFLEHALELWDHRTRRFLEAVAEPVWRMSGELVSGEW